MKRTYKTLISFGAAFALIVTMNSPFVFAADKAPDTAASPAPEADTSQEKSAEKVNVDSIKEKYWARGDQSEMGVIQNRTYTKAGKWELGVFGGTILTDPFLNVNNLGLDLGYHISEYFSVSALLWRSSASNSSALNTFQATEGASTNYNKPRGYYGLEASGSFLYGKLSLMGNSIIYYDMHLLGGLGLTDTVNGQYLTPDIGLGQQVYLSKAVSVRLDYRFMYYHEAIVQNVIIEQLGQTVGYRNNFSNVITLGVSFMFGGASK